MNYLNKHPYHVDRQVAARGHLADGDNSKNVVAGCHASILPIRQVTVGCHIPTYFQIDFIVLVLK